MWIEITEDAIKTRLTGAELTAFQTAALADGQVNPTQEIIDAAIDEVRGYVAACAANTLGPAGTIPPRLLSATINIIRYRLATRLPGMSSLIDDLRQKEYDNALALLRQVAGCNFAVEDPDGDALSGAQVNTPRTTARPRTFNRTSQEGI